MTRRRKMLDMDNKLKQRAIIECLVKKGCPAFEIHEKLQNIYGDAVMDISNVRRWVNKFKEGEKHITDKPRPGRPRTVHTDATKHLIHNMIRSNNRVTIRQMVAKLECGHKPVEMIIDELGYHKVRGRWIQRSIQTETL